MSFVCAISGEVPNEPVISPVSGSLFEKNLIIKHLEMQSTDPINGEELKQTDLIEIKTQQIVKPKVASTNSIPGMLKNLQDEYDALCLNNFKLRKQLRASRQELSNFIYQNQASIEVIARLIKELKAARDAYDSLQPQTPASKLAKEDMIEKATSKIKSDNSNNDDLVRESSQIGPIGFDDTLKTKTIAQSKLLSSKRATRKRNPGASFTKYDSIAQFTVQKSVPGIHSPCMPGIKRVVHMESADSLITAGSDGHVKVYSIDKDQIVYDFKAHSMPITDLTLVSHEDKHTAISSSKDGTISIMDIVSNAEPTEEVQILMPTSNFMPLKGSPVVGHSVGILSKNFLCASSSKWVFTDIERQISIVEGSEDVSNPEKSVPLEKLKYTCTKIHPDGLIFAIGLASGQISIWNLLENKHMCYFDGHKEQIQSLAFSENGYHLASISTDDTLKIWDLRKLSTVVQSIEPRFSSLRSLNYDPNSYLLGVGGSNSLSVYNTQSWKCILTLDDIHNGPINDLAFETDGKRIFTAGQDRTIKVIF